MVHRTIIRYILLVVPALMLMVPNGASARSGKNKSTSASVEKQKKLSSYEKLFDRKRVKSVDGVLKLHIVEGKLYTEIPVALLGRDMLITTTIEESSTSDYGVAGWQPQQPYCINFTRVDSMIYLRQTPPRVITDGKAEMKNALQKSYVNPVVARYPIKAYNSDSSAVVVENTSFFTDKNSNMEAFESAGMGMFYTSIATHKPELSLLKDIRAGSDYVSVVSDMTYGVMTIFFIFPIYKDRPFTATASRTITLLPDSMAKVRVADPRVGASPLPYLKMASDKPAKVEYLAARLDIGSVKSPSPVTFYVDTLFNDAFRKGITDGIAMWNGAFERIGYKNILRTELYPRSKSFDSNSPNGFFIKYAASTNPAIMTTKSVDPRTGEITGARVHIPCNVADEIRARRFIDLAPVLPDARSTKISAQELSKVLSIYVARYTSKALGLEPNYAAAAAYPTDSLRSATFTKKYGISSSITTNNTFNYVASAEDAAAGALLMNDRLGPYDYFAIEWLYSDVDSSTAESEHKALSKLLTDKAGDPLYYYGNFWYDYYFGDVRLAYYNLGDEPISRMRYRFDNLRYFVKNAAQWLRSDDPDFSMREEALRALSSAVSEMFSYASGYIGGTFYQETVEGDGQTMLRAVPKQTQRKILKELLSELSDLSWLDSGELGKGAPVCLSESVRTSSLSWILNKLSNLNRYQNNLAGAYTKQEMADDLLAHIFDKVKKGSAITDMDRTMQMGFTGIVIGQSKVISKPARGASSFAEQDAQFAEVTPTEPSRLPFDGSAVPASVEAFNNYRQRYSVPEYSDHIFYSMLLSVRDIYRSAINTAPDTKSRDFYRFMFNTVEQSLRVD